MEPEQPLQPLVNPPVEAPKQNRKLWWLVGAAVLVLAFGVYMLTKKSAPIKNSSAGASQSAATELYDVLGNAAKQQKIRVAMLRTTYANKADANAKQNPGTIASSVSEADGTISKYRSVFAHNLLRSDKKFSVGRCMDGTTYVEIFESPPAKNTQRATSLAGTASQLRLVPEGNLANGGEPLPSYPCPHLGIMLLEGALPIPVARLSDGVFPVTFTDQQAASWTAAVKKADLFTIKDEGLVTKEGRALKKLSFAPKSEKGVNKQLYDIFYATGNIEKIKAEHPKAEWQYAFITMNPLNTGSVGGFYLIDQKTNLPVYSELYSTNPDKKTDASPAAGKNIARTKQTYAYPKALSLDVNSPLEIVQ